jgi:hypothetical protein
MRKTPEEIQRSRLKLMTERMKAASMEWEEILSQSKNHWQRVLTRMVLLNRDLSVNEKLDLLMDIFQEKK